MDFVGGRVIRVEFFKELSGQVLQTLGQLSENWLLEWRTLEGEEIASAKALREESACYAQGSNKEASRVGVE